MSIAEFKKQFLTKTDEGDCTFRMLPCPFLENNICSQYKYRPKDCRSYPHLHKEDFVFRLIGVIDNYSICPIVFNVYELLKERIWEDAERFSAILHRYRDALCGNLLLITQPVR